jgi:hypothetical protein
MPFVVQKDANVDGEIVTVWLRRTTPWASWGSRSDARRYNSRSEARQAIDAVKRASEAAVLSIVED